MYQQEIKQLLNQIAWIDDLTFYHSLRVGNLMSQFAETSDGKKFLKQAWVTRKEAVVAALLHDVGKALWPPDLLCSSSQLKEMNKDILKEMWACIIEHPLSSEELILKYYNKTGNRFWQRIAQGIVAHHEQFGGGGYPYKLSGQDIALLARGLSVLDQFDTFTSVGRFRITKHQPLNAIKDMRGALGFQYDPYWGNVILDFLERVEIVENLDEWLDSELVKNL